MHAWVGFVFSCAMIVVAAIGKAGYQWMPEYIGATPYTEFMFLLGCAGFGAALAMIAPSHSTARLASVWSAAALGVVVVVLNLDGLDLREERQINPAPDAVVTVPDKTKPEEETVKFVLKRTINEGEWQPFQDLEYRIRQFEREQPPLNPRNETNQIRPQN